MSAANTVHIVPLDDAIAHETGGDEEVCACGPLVQRVARGDGSDGWVYVHNSLDGREHTEAGGTWGSTDG